MLKKIESSNESKIDWASKWVSARKLESAKKWRNVTQSCSQIHVFD